MSNTKYYMDGFAPPTGVQNAEQVATIQRRLGIEDDGIWGPQTELAFRSYMNAMSRSPKKDKANPYQAVTALTNAAKESGRTYGSAGYTANSFPNAPNAYSNLTNVSKEYGKTFGNPGYIPKQVQTAPSTPKQQAEALTNASIDHRTTFGNPGFTPAYLRSLPISQVDAYTALTQASKANQTTFGNPGFVNSNKVNKDDLPKDPQLALEKIIDASSLSNKDKWRANYVIDGMDSEVLQGLLQDVLRDGVASYFSQSAWEDRAALMMSPGAQEDIAAIQDLQAASKNASKTFGNPGFNESTFALRKIELYFTEDKIANRTPKDQAVMQALQTKYNQVVSAGQLEDAEKLFYHIDNYEFLANARKSGINLKNGNESSNDGSYMPAYDPNLTVDTDMGSVSAEYIDVPTDWEALNEHLSPFIPYASLLQIVMKLYKNLDTVEYYRNNPEAILKSGDIWIYFKPNDTGKYTDPASNSYYRNGEWLYTDNTESGNFPTELGPNFDEYAKEVYEGFDPWLIVDILKTIKDFIPVLRNIKLGR